MVFIMFLGILLVALIACAALPWLYYVKSNKTQKNGKIAILSNLISFGSVMLCAIAFIFVGNPVMAETTQAVSSGNSMGYLAAAITTGVACLGSGYAVAQSASAALGAISENENLTGKALIFVALAEGIALYGMVISIIILSKF